jgi:hypothetical protein
LVSPTSILTEEFVNGFPIFSENHFYTIIRTQLAIQIPPLRILVCPTSILTEEFVNGSPIFLENHFYTIIRTQLIATVNGAHITTELA